MYLGDKEIKYLADALQENKVKFAFSFLWYNYLYNFFQTLTDLSVGWNKFGIEGVRYLSDALKMNKVRLIMSLSFLYRVI
jgi:hypothetical protein